MDHVRTVLDVGDSRALIVVKGCDGHHPRSTSDQSSSMDHSLSEGNCGFCLQWVARGPWGTLPSCGRCSLFAVLANHPEATVSAVDEIVGRYSIKFVELLEQHSLQAFSHRDRVTVCSAQGFADHLVDEV